MKTYLRNKWTGVVSSGPADEEFEDLAGRYTEPHRHYHTLDHVTALLRMADELGFGKPAITLAAFYHDAVYDPKSRENELESARLARRSMERLKLDALIGPVEEMVLATQNHLHPPDSPDAKTFLDLDFAILGAPPESYRAYVENIEREYAWMPVSEFRSARGAFLKRILDSEHLFHTEPFRARYEPQARKNIEAELAQI